MTSYPPPSSSDSQQVIEVDLMTPSTPWAAWPDVQAVLRPQMTRQTYDTHINDAAAYRDNNHVTIVAPSDLSREWIENRLASTIRRAVVAVTGQADIQLIFKAKDQLPPLPLGEGKGERAADPRAELLRTVARSAILEFNVFEHGYIGHPHYIQRFWGAYLGAAAMAVYLYIRSFYKIPYLKDGSLNPDWTPWTSLRTERDGGSYRPAELLLAINSRQVKHPNTGKICGRWRTCPVFEQEYQQGNIWTSCQCNQNRGQMTDAPPSEAYPAGRRICHYWDPGIMERLAAEGILLYERTGDPRKPRTVFYLAQVYQMLPLLSPRQVASLNEKTRKEHEAYLYAHEVNLDHWTSEFANEASIVPLAISWDGAVLTPPA